MINHERTNDEDGVEWFCDPVTLEWHVDKLRFS
jgi:hypothetical protein